VSDPIELLTLAEVAERLRVSRRTVERLVAAGRLRVVGVGRRRMVTNREIEAFVAAVEGLDATLQRDRLS
jgi:excisionase family DNA binding protein